MNQAANTAYFAHYNAAFTGIALIVDALTERPTPLIQEIMKDKNPEEGFNALFDAVLDHGHREVLIKLHESGSLPDWVREKLDIRLYGCSSRRPPALFVARRHLQ